MSLLRMFSAPFTGYSISSLYERLKNGNALPIRSITALCTAYYCGVLVYRMFFHPLAKFPGPRLAAVSNVWYAFAWFSGRYPWKIEAAFKKYGDVVRIAPNELVFITPKAGKDIHAAARHGRELFLKTNFQDFGLAEKGITAEDDPERHHSMAKMLAPAVSPRAVREQEPIIHQHVDLLVRQLQSEMRENGMVEVNKWIDWHFWDVAGDLAYNAQFNQVQDKKDELFFKNFMKVGLWATTQQVARRFPWLSPLMWLCIPPSVVLTFPTGIRVQAAEVKRRVQLGDQVRHPDYLGHFINAKGSIPTQQLLLANANVMIVANFDPMTNAASCALYHLLLDPVALQRLREDLLREFKSADEIVHDRLQKLKYLHAVIYESLRIHTNAVFGLPRYSPGATIDGWYIPKGVTVQTSLFAMAHSERWFRDSREFHPERFLPHDHAYFDPRYLDDAVGDFAPFSQGPRGCPGSLPAMQRLRIFLAKLVWFFDMKPAHKTEAVDWEKDSRIYGIWDRPDVWAILTVRSDQNGIAMLA